MKVIELIGLLQTMPPDAEVIYDFRSEKETLEAEDVRLRPAESREVIKHCGRYMSFNRSYFETEEGAEFVTVVNLPGN